MQHLTVFLFVCLSLASAYTSDFDGGNSIERPESQDASISNILKRLRRAAPDVVNVGSSNRNFRFGDSSASNVVRNVENHGSGDIREFFGDCSVASIMTSAKLHGSGDLHLVYKNRPYGSNASAADVPRNANSYGEWPRNIICRGSGDIDVVYGHCRPAESRLTQNINIHGSGDIRIEFGKSTTSEVHHRIYIAGSGNVYLEYDICYAPTSNVRSNANSGEELARSVVIVGSGRLYTKCGNRRANRVSI